MDKLTILIDMDDTMVDLMSAWIQRLNKQYGLSIKNSDICVWDLMQIFTTLTKEQIYAPLHDASLWDELKPIEGSAKYIKKLMDDGHEVYIVTSAHYKTFQPNEIDYMLEKGINGNILNIASNAACMDIIGSYGAAKEAIIKWTRAFGKRYGHNGIIINGIAPGATFTPMIARYAHHIDQKYERHAIERFIRPDEIAELAFYLMSDYGEIICGHTVVADGGDNAATL